MSWMPCADPILGDKMAASGGGACPFGVGAFGAEGCRQYE
jgi:hypothetical protein